MIDNRTYKRALITTVILLIITIFCYWNKYNQLDSASKEITSLNRKIGEFKVREGRNKSVIVEQQQNIVDLRTALKETFDEKERWKSIKSKVVVETEIKIDTVFIPFIDTLYQTDTIYPTGTIKVPKRFSKEDTFYSIKGIVLLDGILIDSLSIPNEMKAIIGSKKDKWWKKATPVVQVTNSNKYLTVQSVDNIVVEEKKKFYQKNSFWTIIGLTLGITTLTLIK